MKSLLLMYSEKPLIVSILSLLGIQVLDVVDFFKMVSPLITEFGQAIIVVLTVIYMIRKNLGKKHNGDL